MSEGKVSGASRESAGDDVGRPDDTLMGVAPPWKIPVRATGAAPVTVRGGSIPDGADAESSPPSPPTGTRETHASIWPIASSPEQSEPLVLAEHVHRSDWPLFKNGNPLGTRKRALMAGITLFLLTAGLGVLVLKPAAERPASSTREMERGTPASVSNVVDPSARQPAGPMIPTPIQVSPAGSSTSREILLLAESNLQNERLAMARLHQQLRDDPGMVGERIALRDLQRAVFNPATTSEALSAIIELPGALGTDILYEIWDSAASRNGTTELLRALLYSSDLKRRASAALAFVLDLRAAERCEEVADVLERQRTSADARAWPLLLKLTKRYGCGQNNRQDCYPCLRNSSDLHDAIKLSKMRVAPVFLGRRPK